MTATLTNLSRLLVLLWAGLIFYLSSQPGIDVPLLFPGQDKLFHATTYGVLGFLVAGSMRPRHGGLDTGQLISAAVIVALYGLSDEFHQSFVPGRSADIFDVLADISGGLAGIWLLVFIYRKLNQP